MINHPDDLSTPAPVEPGRYFVRPATAYVLGMNAMGTDLMLKPALTGRTCDDLSGDEQRQVIAAGLDAGLRLHKFKRTMGLARVERVLGILRGLMPENVLDVGSGRGVFLWPLLDAFPRLPVTASDREAFRVADVEAVRRGGVTNLTARRLDATRMDLPDGSFDVVTVLEVLEHIPNPQRALEEAIRVARRFVVLSVPSQPDDNPQHLHHFDRAALERMSRAAGAANVNVQHVLNHAIAVIRVAPAMTPDLRKYPRTFHIEGSRVQPGDENLDAVPFRAIAGRHIIVEEKVDGANAALRFDPNGRLLLQSRGHYLTGGPRERHFALFKQWAHAHAGQFRAVLGTRYVLFGEWLYAKHTIFYDRLPHYFLEFDVLDTERDTFLSTPCRHELLHELPIASVPVLHAGPMRTLGELAAFVGPSAFISGNHLDRLRDLCEERGLDAARILAETDRVTTMEGLYLKVEEGNAVTSRFKFIRASYLQAVLDSGDHWLDRPIVPNQLRSDADIFAEHLP